MPKRQPSLHHHSLPRPQHPLQHRLPLQQAIHLHQPVHPAQPGQLAFGQLAGGGDALVDQLLRELVLGGLNRRLERI